MFYAVLWRLNLKIKAQVLVGENFNWILIKNWATLPTRTLKIDFTMLDNDV